MGGLYVLLVPGCLAGVAGLVVLLASVEERLLGRPLEQESLEEVRVSSHTELVEDPEPPRADPHLRRGFKTLRSSKKPDSDGEEPSMALLGGEA